MNFDIIELSRGAGLSFAVMVIVTIVVVKAFRDDNKPHKKSSKK